MCGFQSIDDCFSELIVDGVVKFFIISRKKSTAWSVRKINETLAGFSYTYQGGSSPADLSTRYLYFQDRFTFQLQTASIASAEIELISLGDKFVPGDFDGDGDHDIDDYNASGAALGLCAADANRDSIVDFGDLLIVINDWGTTCE